MEIAKNYVYKAKKALEVFPDSTHRQTLFRIADYILLRNK
jgi:geranylgeranyl pyrophosphate synthase